MSHYIVQSAAAQMPSSVKARYRKVAVLEVEDGIDRVAMISPRARGVIRIVHLRDRLNVGRQVRSAYAKALQWAEEYAKELNANGK